MPTPEEITRHHADADVVYVRAHKTGYTVRIEEPDPSWPDRYRALEAQIRDALRDRVLDIDLTVADPADEAAYVPDREVLGITHHEDRELYAAAKRKAATRLTSTRAGDDVLGPGMRYNRIKEPVVREIYDRMFRAAGLID